MNTELIGLTLDVIGKIMIAYMAIRVHQRFRKEHAVDERVFAVMKNEQVIGIVGIVLIVAGYLLQISTRA